MYSKCHESVSTSASRGARTQQHAQATGQTGQLFDRLRNSPQNAPFGRYARFGRAPSLQHAVLEQLVIGIWSGNPADTAVDLGPRPVAPMGSAGFRADVLEGMFSRQYFPTAAHLIDQLDRIEQALEPAMRHEMGHEVGPVGRSEQPERRIRERPGDRPGESVLPRLLEQFPVAAGIPTRLTFPKRVRVELPYMPVFSALPPRARVSLTMPAPSAEDGPPPPPYSTSLASEQTSIPPPWQPHPGLRRPLNAHAGHASSPGSRMGRATHDTIISASPPSPPSAQMKVRRDSTPSSPPSAQMGVRRDSAFPIASVQLPARETRRPRQTAPDEATDSEEPHSPTSSSDVGDGSSPSLDHGPDANHMNWRPGGAAAHDHQPDTQGGVIFPGLAPTKHHDRQPSSWRRIMAEPPPPSRPRLGLAQLPPPREPREPAYRAADLPGYTLAAVSPRNHGAWEAGALREARQPHFGLREPARGAPDLTSYTPTAAPPRNREAWEAGALRAARQPYSGPREQGGRGYGSERSSSPRRSRSRWRRETREDPPWYAENTDSDW
ncbi:hypothetical protein DL766_004351 [Monosporascus sp. MC13-8B]|uniref:Uncharacterized protein n=1 Tax=Monosporascus cannonballus TaxID=155416 RepID=A0ABY0H6I7_9PEZI|nr:hypothetical protein DL762_004845 [Monosporascus cannonballus]RYO93013.1 hypothetical protein DL763_004513 [Monosporascus cannonballus]RYP31481.1 hypothetical protein DL766_004351 [Monosporascus sp. MC13-8B]